MLSAIDARANLRIGTQAIVRNLLSRMPSWALKRRDKREPGRKEKEEAEDRLARAMWRIFRRQRQQIRERLEMRNPDRKAIPMPPDVFDDIWEPDDDEVAELYRILKDATRHGINLFGAGKPEIDYTLVNSRAAQWARDYAYDLVKEINSTSRRTLQQAISGFVETPGMTIGDVMDLLGFEEERAMRVAVTEITRAYSEANQEAGRELAKQFPDVPVKKRWYTNNDEVVCTEICQPLDGVEVNWDEGFTPEGGGEGIMGPPAHPNCRCWTETYTALAELEEEVTQAPKEEMPTEEPSIEEWQPSMPLEQINKWNQDSAYKNTVYHGTSKYNAELIKKDGFVIPKDPKFGRFYGDGVYVTQDYNFAESFARRIEGETLKTKINIHNPFYIEGSEFHDKIVAPIVDRLASSGLPADTVQRMIPNEITKYLVDLGYDSIITEENASKIMVIFNPKNIAVVK